MSRPRSTKQLPQAKVEGEPGLIFDLSIPKGPQPSKTVHRTLYSAVDRLFSIHRPAFFGPHYTPWAQVQIDMPRGPGNNCPGQSTDPERWCERCRTISTLPEGQKTIEVLRVMACMCTELWGFHSVEVSYMSELCEGPNQLI